jgi:putative FmdB family regulatory protein
MPLYEYRCDACNHQFEVIQKFSDAPIAVCPSCGGGPIGKLQSSPAIQFKGSGWYITDYARKDQGRSGKGGESSRGDDAGKSDGSTGGESKGGESKSSESSSPSNSPPPSGASSSATAAADKKSTA